LHDFEKKYPRKEEEEEENSLRLSHIHYHIEEYMLHLLVYRCRIINISFLSKLIAYHLIITRANRDSDELVRC
jgi:hypothetical protein